MCSFPQVSAMEEANVQQCEGALALADEVRAAKEVEVVALAARAGGGVAPPQVLSVFLWGAWRLFFRTCPCSRWKRQARH